MIGCNDTGDKKVPTPPEEPVARLFKNTAGEYCLRWEVAGHDPRTEMFCSFLKSSIRKLERSQGKYVKGGKRKKSSNVETQLEREPERNDGDLIYTWWEGKGTGTCGLGLTDKAGQADIQVMFDYLTRVRNDFESKDFRQLPTL